MAKRLTYTRATIVYAMQRHAEAGRIVAWEERGAGFVVTIHTGIESKPTEEWELRSLREARAFFAGLQSARFTPTREEATP